MCFFIRSLPYSPSFANFFSPTENFFLSTKALHLSTILDQYLGLTSGPTSIPACLTRHMPGTWRGTACQRRAEPGRHGGMASAHAQAYGLAWHVRAEPCPGSIELYWSIIGSFLQIVFEIIEIPVANILLRLLILLAS